MIPRMDITIGKFAAICIFLMNGQVLHIFAETNNGMPVLTANSGDQKMPEVNLARLTIDEMESFFRSEISKKQYHNIQGGLHDPRGEVHILALAYLIKSEISREDFQEVLISVLMNSAVWPDPERDEVVFEISGAKNVQRDYFQALFCIAINKAFGNEINNNHQLWSRSDRMELVKTLAGPSALTKLADPSEARRITGRNGNASKESTQSTREQDRVVTAENSAASTQQGRSFVTTLASNQWIKISGLAIIGFVVCLFYLRKLRRTMRGTREK